MDWMKSNKWHSILPIIIAGWCISGVFTTNRAGTVDPQGETSTASHVDFTSSNLPIMIIDTHGQTIQDARKITADMGIIDNARGNRNSVTDPWNGYDGKIGIELRGSTAQQFPKKPYAIETRDSLGNNFNTSLLGMPRENDWVLYNPYTDKSMLRNVLSYKMSRDIGRYASRTRLIELVLNGDYRGVYVLMEKIKQDKNRVDISKMDSTDTGGDALTGGYIIKIDKTTGDNTGGWNSTKRTPYQYHYPKPDDIIPGQKDYIKNFMNGFEAVMDGPNYADPVNGYAKYIDLDSFVDNFIISEVNRNIDAYRLSMFLYKDRDSKDGRLHAGPVWDCDLAFGNANYYDGWLAEGCNLDVLSQTGDAYKVPFWWVKLRNDAGFLARARERWLEFRNDALNTDSLAAFIDATVDTLDEAQARNYRLYPILESQVWPNYYVWPTFEEEVEFLKEWVQNRIAWIDEAIEGAVSGISGKTDAVIPNNCRLEQNYPNPFNSSTVIGMELKSSTTASVGIYDLRGRLVTTLLDGFQQAGRRTLVWNGRNESGRTVPSGVYMIRLEAGTETHTRKLLFLQ